MARAIGVAVVGGLFGGKNSVVAVVAREIQRAIIRNDIEMARSLLRDMQWRHAESLREFLRKYGDNLPPEFVEEFRDFMK
ncbi:MAG: hypothetical protein V1792_09705 [Pseudomonadota bacterium]